MLADVADAGEKHLVVRAMRVTFDALGTGQPPGLALSCVNRIPAARGLGSSAAAWVAGLVAGGALAGNALSREALLDAAARAEGHPDNVAAALLGGLTVSCASGDRITAISLPVPPAVRWVVLIPEAQGSTREARAVLPPLLEAVGFRRGLLVGHSDGASIAAVYAGSHQDHRVRAVALIAPHFIVEDVSVASIAEIKTTYETTDLRAKLARWHKDVDNAFCGWNGAWLDPKFRNWDISDYLAFIRVPVAIIQGADDQYGTIRQVEIAKQECYCPVDVTIIVGAGHSPHREAPAATLNVILEFANAVLQTHEGFQGRAA